MSDSLDRGLNVDSNLLSSIANPKTINWLGIQGGAAETAEKIWATREWQAKQAQGEAAQGAIDRTTGAYSPERARQLNAATGQTGALGAQDALLNTQRLSDSQIAQAQKKIDWVNSSLAGLLSTGDTSDAGITKMFHDGAANGMLTSGEIASQMPQVMQLGPAERLAWMRAHVVTHQQAETQLNMTRGTPYAQQQGGTIGSGTTDPWTGAQRPAGSVPMGLTPGEKTQTQTVVGPGGQKGTQPIGSKYNDDGTLKQPGWGLNNGKYQVPGGAAPPPAGFTATENPPGFDESQQAAARVGTGIYAQADAATMQKSQLLTMESDLNAISTGPVTDRLARFNALTQKLGIGGITMTADELAKSESFAKVGKQIALAQAGAMGVGTDEKLTTTMGANPNRDLSKLGNKQIIAMLQGNADALKARGVAYDQWLKAGNSPGNAQAFLTDFNKTYDPRVYQWQYQIKDMTEPQRKAAFEAMPDREQFRQNYNTAVRGGLIGG